VSEPSWTTALAEAKSASRHLAHALKAMEGLAQELRALRDASDATARLDLARALTEGSDGGVLQSIVAASADSDAGARRTAEVLVDRLTGVLGLAQIGARGELLKLRPEQLAEFDLRGPTTSEAELYCVVRPGWSLGAHIVARPLLEAVRI
jgi:hypothetical protein